MSPKSKLSYPGPYQGYPGPMTNWAYCPPPPRPLGADTIVVYDRATTNHTGKFKRCV